MNSRNINSGYSFHISCNERKRNKMRLRRSSRTLFLRALPPSTASATKSLIAISLLVMFACAHALYRPTQELAQKSGIPLERLEQGRQLYIDHCGSCHMLYLPSRFSVEKWRVEMEAMRSRVTLNDEESTQILVYLLAGK